MKNEPDSRYEDFLKLFPYETEGWTGKITFCFSYAQIGWVLLWISTTSYLQHITIHLSDVFDPFPDLIRWIEAIAESRLPSEIEIDEEGVIKQLYANHAGNNLVDIQIKDDDGKIIFRCRCDRRQLVNEFVNKFELFREQYFETKDWRYGPGPLAASLTKLKTFYE